MTKKLKLENKEIPFKTLMAISRLREEEQFNDCTLITDAGNISCQKIMLAAHSPFFKQIITRMDVAKPTIFLRNINHTYLQHIIDFMYSGHVFIQEAEFDDFMATAQDLRVEDLIKNLPQHEDVYNNSKDDSKMIKLEESLTRALADEQQKEYKVEEEKEEEEKEVDGLLKLPDGKVTCLKCNKVLGNQASANRHYTTAHMTLPRIKCKLCKKTFKNKASLGKHVKSAHGIKASALKNIIKPPQPPEVKDEVMDDEE